MGKRLRGIRYHRHLMNLLHRLHQRICVLFLALACMCGAGAQGTASVVQTPQVRAELMVWAPQGLAAGQTMWLGLYLQHQKGWHTYWKNPGDSGLPTQLQWQLPTGWAAGETHWPIPHKIRVGEMTNYGFEGKALLAAPLTISDKAPSLSEPEMVLQAAWLVCRQECIPQEGRFVLRLPSQASLASHTTLFEGLLQQQPQPLPAGNSKAQLASDHLQLTVAGLPAAARLQNISVFVELPEVVDHAGETHPRSQAQWTGDQWQVTLPLHPMRSTQPAQLPLVLVMAQGASQTAWRMQIPVSGSWPTLPSPALAASAPPFNPAKPLASPSEPETAWGLGFWLALVSALVGGLLLNLMPCVLPVLAIKVVGLGLPGQTVAQRRWGGLAYSLGVVLTFMALGASVLAFRSAGEQLGWGFQLQSPWFVGALALLFTVLALNLMGLFEWGPLWPSSWASWQSQHPGLNAFASGVLAVGLASPCTAPFVGVSMGWALSQTWPSAMAVLATMGLGMALPFALLSHWPALGKYLPQPGPWMAVFKSLMAFPLWLTVIWLLWIIGQQTNLDTTMSVLLLLLATAAMAWCSGLSASLRQWLLILASACWLASAAVVWPRLTANDAAPAAADSHWQTWSPQAVQDKLAQGQMVFVDFTAAWCVTCQLNKQTTLQNAQVLQDFERHQVALMRADWTRRDPTITRALAQLGRSGVPVYVLYKPGQPPLVLSELLNPALVQNAIAAR